MSYTFRIILRPEPEGGYTVLVPALPGCVTFGETVEEAHKMGKEAIEAYVESMKEHGEVIVDDTRTFDAQIQIAVA
ncbi:MAG TPA: type II toxin-antitoxin system HicB family antitoxin [Candidatus Peribacterales bacterium]|nr:type II toxin-antitoxin system HicB family antitoxin [Candidatus Peribacterales bacterium]